MLSVAFASTQTVSGRDFHDKNLARLSDIDGAASATQAWLEPEATRAIQVKEFHWEEYYRLNPDLPARGMHTPEQAWSHYRCCHT